MPEYRKLIPRTFNGDLQRNPPENLVSVTDANENHLMTHCFGQPEGL